MIDRILGDAISEIKIALPILRGMAITIAPIVTSNVPTISENAP
jgi:hypothetical protein